MRAVSLLSRGITLLLCLCSAATTTATAAAAEDTPPAVDTAKYPNAITLSYEFISSTPQSVKPLCTIFYDPRTLRYKLLSWTPPPTAAAAAAEEEEEEEVDEKQEDLTTAAATNSPLIRILLPNGSSTVTTLATFASNLTQDITLWVSSSSGSGSGSIVSASIRSISPPPLSAEDERARKRIERAIARHRPKVTVNLVPVTPGPTPKLGSRAPPPVDADGNEIVPQQEQEKTFFQKYWWVFLALSLVLVGGGGGGDK
ncbi:hypothetical protein DV738_g4800, partial [Chaetothyriales sp. CBS 135597]